MKDQTRFPNGVYVVFANDYEYTDTSGDLLSCPAASLAGFKRNWPQGAPAVVHFQEQLMKIAVDDEDRHRVSARALLRARLSRTDPSLQCYRGPNAELWFDLTCIHPKPTGHAHIADLFQQVIDG